MFFDDNLDIAITMAETFELKNRAENWKIWDPKNLGNISDFSPVPVKGAINVNRITLEIQDLSDQDPDGFLKVLRVDLSRYR